jgi:hypothetical protein
MWPLKNRISYLRYKDVKLDYDENKLIDSQKTMF